jgi:hypothetical protein
MDSTIKNILIKIEHLNGETISVQYEGSPNSKIVLGKFLIDFFKNIQKNVEEDVLTSSNSVVPRSENTLEGSVIKNEFEQFFTTFSELTAMYTFGDFLAFIITILLIKVFVEIWYM